MERERAKPTFGNLSFLIPIRRQWKEKERAKKVTRANGSKNDRSIQSHLIGLNWNGRCRLLASIALVIVVVVISAVVVAVAATTDDVEPTTCSMLSRFIHCEISREERKREREDENAQ